MDEGHPISQPRMVLEKYLGQIRLRREPAQPTGDVGFVVGWAVISLSGLQPRRGPVLEWFCRGFLPDCSP
jgi:hypothetical protein